MRRPGPHMKLNVKLFSVLQECVPDYDPDVGLEIELKPEARVSDLVNFLKIPPEKAPVVTCNGRIMKADDPLNDGGVVQIFQPIAGG